MLFPQNIYIISNNRRLSMKVLLVGQKENKREKPSPHDGIQGLARHFKPSATRQTMMEFHLQNLNNDATNVEFHRPRVLAEFYERGRYQRIRSLRRQINTSARDLPNGRPSELSSLNSAAIAKISTCPLKNGMPTDTFTSPSAGTSI